MGNAKLLPAIGLVLLAAVGCGDGPICQSETLLIIQTPQGLVLGDSNDQMGGVQTDVRVRSTLGEDIDVELAVLDEDGGELYTDTVATDANGDVTFEDVDLPDGAVAIRVAADAGECGSDEDEVAIDVAAGRGCELTLQQEPLDNDFYAPLGVLAISNDPNQAMPNFQADIDVETAPGYDIELFVAGDTGETSAGTETADDTGAASFAISLGQGLQGLRAVCTDPSGALVSPSIVTSVFVDTEAPDCEMAFPAPGDPISPTMDNDNDDSNGLQITFIAHAGGGDVEGEAATFVLTVGAPTTLTASDFDAGGDSTADGTISLTATPTEASVDFSGSDHAGNDCAISEDYEIQYVCANPGFGEIGGTCLTASNCGTADSQCYLGSFGPQTFAPEGYCMVDDFGSATGTCDDDTDCPLDTTCTEWLEFPGYRSCMPVCGCQGTPCPDNQACFDHFVASPLDKAVCVPGNASAEDGDACGGFFDCDELTDCLDDAEFPNGQCARYGCTIGNDATCNGGHCVNVTDVPFSGTTCVDTCTSNTDCRTADGYVCFDPDGAGTAQNYCRHPHIGDACTIAADCGGAGWTCRTGATNPGGYCTQTGCPTPGSSAGCTDGSICIDDPLSATNYCADRCTGLPAQGTCRTGYLCTDSNGAAPGALGGCAPP